MQGRIGNLSKTIGRRGAETFDFGATKMELNRIYFSIVLPISLGPHLDTVITEY